MKKTLVCIIAQTRSHEVTWDKFEKNLLNELNADLALCIGVTENYNFNNPFGKQDGTTTKAVKSGGAAYEDKQLGYIIINTQGNKNATAEMCFKTPCNTKDENGNFSNLLSMSVALQ